MAQSAALHHALRAQASAARGPGRPQGGGDHWRRQAGGVGVGVGVGGGPRRRPLMQRAAAGAAAAAHEEEGHWSLAPYDPDERALVDRLLTSPLADLMAEARHARDALWRGDLYDADTGASGGSENAAPPPLLPRPVTFSPKVFIPLTRACRDACGYCTFAQAPPPSSPPPADRPKGAAAAPSPAAAARRVFMTLDEVAAVARSGARRGCTEALLTLGDNPEALYPQAAAELRSGELGGVGHYSSTLEYVEAACARVLAETGLLPHVNAGLADEAWSRRLKRVSASQGLMLEGVDPALRLPGAAHDARTCPDKDPLLRLRAIEAAGRARVPFTTGVLVGIGESRAERLRALVAISRLHGRYGHVQEAIVQNFVAKPGTAMAAWPEPPLEELLWSVACARLLLPPEVSVQAPPNLTPPVHAAAAAGGGGGGASYSAGSSPGGVAAAAAAAGAEQRGGDAGAADADADADADGPQFPPPCSEQEEALAASWRALLDAGINDWGGVSPLTRDWVNPERPWPHVEALARATARATAGRPLLPRLPVYPRYSLGQLPGSVGAGGGRRRRRRAGGEGEEEEDGGGGGGGDDDGWLCEAGGPFSVAAAVRRHSDASGLSRGLGGWFAGVPEEEEAEEEDGKAEGEEEEEAREARGPAAAPPTPPPPRDKTTTAAKRPAPGGLLVLPPSSSSSSSPRPRGWAVALDAYGGTLAGLPAPSDVTPALRSLLERLLDPARDGAAAERGGRPPSISSSSSAGAPPPPTAREVQALLTARGADAEAVRAAADALRARACGDTVSYVVNRNLNYTNVCSYGCTFCGFSKARPGEEDGEGAMAAGSSEAGGGPPAAAQPPPRRDPPYVVPAHEVARRAREAWERGATEICLQGGIHPSSTGETYLELLRAAKRGAPGIHVHAFSPLEIRHGAETLGLSAEEFLRELRRAGLGSLPGTAAEILHDDVRRAVCPDKLTTREWCEVMEAAAAVAAAEEEEEEEDDDEAAEAAAAAGGISAPPPPRRRPPLRATSTMMFGTCDTPAHQAHHLLLLRDLQVRTRGLFTEFVPLPFVHMGAPSYGRGEARRGPTLREAVLAHSAARLVLHPVIPNIQASWVKMGPAQIPALLAAGCNDLGGVLMNESISRAAGAAHGQELGAREMERLVRACPGRVARQRTTTYFGDPDPAQVARSLSEAGARPLAPVVKLPAAGGARALAEAGWGGARL